MRFARRQIVVRIRTSADRLLLLIEDDGPGISSDRMLDPVARGVRLDETTHGHGLGLSIATALTRASGGQLSLTRSTLGGLCMEILWPCPDGLRP